MRDKHREDRNERVGSRHTQPTPPDGVGMPRSLKYAWGIGMTVLVAVGMALDRGSPFMPLVNRLIDALQTEMAPVNGSK